MAKLPTTWEQVCKINGIDPKNIPTFSEIEDDEYNEGFKKSLIADWKIMHITKAINSKNWKADYSNRKQAKWYPIFIWDASLSAFRFLAANNGCECAYAGSGVRRTFETRAKTEHAGKFFIDIYNEALT